MKTKCARYKCKERKVSIKIAVVKNPNLRKEDDLIVRMEYHQGTLTGQNHLTKKWRITKGNS